jgi:hypothetical protein
MRLARTLAKAAVVIGLLGGPVTACVGVVQGMATGLASSGGDCGGGCAERHASEESQAHELVVIGLIGGAALLLGGMIALRVLPRVEPAGSPPAKLSPARVIDDSSTT